MVLAHARFETRAQRFDRIAYACSGGRLHDAERIALSTLDTLRDRGRPLLLAPAGEAHEVARERGIESRVVRGKLDWWRQIARLRGEAGRVAFFSTTTSQSLAFAASRPLLAADESVHLHVVQDSRDLQRNYGSKSMLLALNLQFVAVSRHVADALGALGVPASRVELIHSSVAPGETDSVAAMPARPRLLVCGQLLAEERIDLLFDALRMLRDGARIPVDVVGHGPALRSLRNDAADLPNVTFHGSQRDLAPFLGRADLLVHTSPDDPTGLAVAEAMAHGVPVLVPDRAGPADLVVDGGNGYRYRAGSFTSLALRLTEVRLSALDRHQEIAAAGRASAMDKLSPEALRAGLLRCLSRGDAETTQRGVLRAGSAGRLLHMPPSPPTS